MERGKTRTRRSRYLQRSRIQRCWQSPYHWRKKEEVVVKNLSSVKIEGKWGKLSVRHHEEVENPLSKS